MHLADVITKAEEKGYEGGSVRKVAPGYSGGEVMRGGHQLKLGISQQVASAAYSSGALIIGHQ